VNYDDETLMAYADGELDADQRAAITAAIEKDQALAARVAQHRAIRGQIADAYAPVLEQPVPAELRDAVAAARQTGNKVIEFPKNTGRAVAQRWGKREWLAMAASILLGVVFTWRFMGPEGANVLSEDGKLVASGRLDYALSKQLASAQRNEQEVSIGVTFRSKTGEYCRSFNLHESDIAGLACRTQDRWRIEALHAMPAQSEGMRQAGSSMPPEVLALVEQRIAGEPLDATAEQGALLSDWDPAH